MRPRSSAVWSKSAGRRARCSTSIFPTAPARAVKGVAVVAQGTRDLSGSTLERRVDTRGRSYYWLGFRPRRSNPPAGTDLHAVAAKKISVTPLHLNLTERRVLEKMKRRLGQTLSKG